VRGWKTSALDRLLAPLVDRGVVRLLGHVPDADLPALYAHAAACLYMSRYEGFGLPVAEAMACGGVVLAANATSIPEVAGDAAVLLAPDDVDALRQAMCATLEAPEQFGALRTRAQTEARQRLQWHRCAELTVQAYRSCLG
jgi:alpha-1,3-rhamnosyl/mannosyltransferase